jgi:ATP-GRASP peptide maturase of grasp-with-spasm system
MIAILSKSDSEETTNDVIDWLKYYNANFIRVNGDVFFNKFDWTLGEDYFLDSIFEKVNVYWFRRWLSDHHIIDSIDNNQTRSVDLLKIFNHLIYERNSLNNIIWKYLKSKKGLTKPYIRHRKIDVLNEAQKLDIKIPVTIITTQKERLTYFLKQHSRIISKPVSDSHPFFDDEYGYSFKTAEITYDFIESLPEQFPPTLFQQLIEKDYEIRAFFLNKKIWAMAIFSQLDKQTSVDFRFYNKAKPNRYVPYILPSDLEEKIIKLMTKLDSDTGSIDILRSTNGLYYFLEVNLAGQFGMTSIPCNYYLELEVAKYLITNDYAEY